MERSLVVSGWLDAEIDASFPASDPLSHWAGPRRRETGAERTHGSVDRRPVGDAPGPQHPEAAMPDTL